MRITDVRNCVWSNPMNTEIVKKMNKRKNYYLLVSEMIPSFYFWARFVCICLLAFPNIAFHAIYSDWQQKAWEVWFRVIINCCSKKYLENICQKIVSLWVCIMYSWVARIHSNTFYWKWLTMLVCLILTTFFQFVYKQSLIQIKFIKKSSKSLEIIWNLTFENHKPLLRTFIL